jgi:hypothetical protein
MVALLTDLRVQHCLGILTKRSVLLLWVSIVACGLTHGLPLPSSDMPCIIPTPAGNVSLEGLQFYGNVSGWELNGTQAWLSVSLCSPMRMGCASAAGAYLILVPDGAPCIAADIFTLVATPPSYSDNMTSLQLESSSYLANLHISCKAHVQGLQPDTEQESYISGDTFFIYLASEQACPGFTPTSGSDSSSSGADRLTRSETAGIVVGIFALVLIVSIAIVRVRARVKREPGALNYQYQRIA